MCSSGRDAVDFPFVCVCHHAECKTGRDAQTAAIPVCCSSPSRPPPKSHRPPDYLITYYILLDHILRMLSRRPSTEYFGD